MYTKKQIAAARKVAKAKYGVRKLLSIDVDPKTAKSNKAGKGYYTAILYMAPAMLGGYQACASAIDCIKGCLHTAGNPVYMRAKEAARIARKRLFFEDRELFAILLWAEIKAFEKLCVKNGLKPAIRPNGTTDIVWERIFPWLFTEFTGVQFYDYTKHLKRVQKDWVLPANYHLTFSRQQANEVNLFDVLMAGTNIAVVFRNKKTMPTQYKGFRVVNGDETDLRFLDVHSSAVVIGLSAKGQAKKDTEGFVVD